MSGESGRAGGNDKKCGEEIEQGKGDSRVLFVMNLVLLTVFVAVVVYGLSYIDLTTFPVISVASAAFVLTTVTYLVTN